jgi:hypothetical protein
MNECEGDHVTGLLDAVTRVCTGYPGLKSRTALQRKEFSISCSGVFLADIHAWIFRSSSSCAQ